MVLRDWIIITGIVIGFLSGGFFGCWLTAKYNKEFENLCSPIEITVYIGTGMIFGSAIGLFAGLFAAYFPPILVAIILSIIMIMKMEKVRKASLEIGEAEEKQNFASLNKRLDAYDYSSPF
jgi:ABC-type uncharacterized transport system permease subunit